MADDAPLLAALAVIQARGAIGERALVDAVAHADRFVALIPPDARTLVDLGSGGGLPALVIAWRRPDLAVTMVERRSTRADLLRRAVTSLALDGRASVVATDVAAVCRERPHSFDVATARSFAEPAVTAKVVDALLDAHGIGLVSEPPEDRTAIWSRALADGANLVDGGLEQGIRRLLRPSVAH
jgi:16S rRNA (guanine527-N7)-methyltransferase